MFNSHTIIGMIAAEPRDNGKCVRLRVKTWAEGKGKRYETNHFIECWGNSAEIARNFVEGDTILVSGRSQSVKNEYNGETKWTTVIKAMEIAPMGDKTGARGEGGGSAGKAYEDGEVPF